MRWLWAAFGACMGGIYDLYGVYIFEGSSDGRRFHGNLRWALENKNGIRMNLL